MDDEATRIGPRPAGGGRLPVGMVLNHTYEIIRFIQAGGMGEVYEAKHLVDDSRMAIKIIRPDLVGDDRIHAMFVREAGILRRIKSDAVVGYEGLQREEREGGFLVFLAMSYVDGLSLADRIRTQPLNAAEATQLLERLAHGLSEVHAEGTFHRDLSPDNILLPANDLDQAKIIDFGIAKLAEPQSGTLVGTDMAGKFGYMSPEQLGVVQQEVDARSDIYSLGLIIVTAVRGSPLPIGNTHADIVRSRQRVPDLEGIPEPLRGRLAAMLQPDPADRPQSMDELLTNATAKKGTRFSPRGAALESPTYEPDVGVKKREAPRHLKPILGGAAALLAVVVLGFLFVVSPRQEIEEIPSEDVVGGEEDSTITTAPEEPPALDLAAIEAAANQALAELPCSALQTQIGQNGVATVSGVFGLLSSVTQIDDLLAYVQGIAGVETNNVSRQIEPVCAARALIARNATYLGVGLRTNHVDSRFVDGDVLVTSADITNGSPMHLYVDFIDPGGDVIHLKPNPFDPATTTDGLSEIQMGAEPPGKPAYRVGAPYGTAVVIATMSSRPLFDTIRPHSEPAELYLRELEEALRQQSWDFQGGWLDVNIVGPQ